MSLCLIIEMETRYNGSSEGITGRREELPGDMTPELRAPVIVALGQVRWGREISHKEGRPESTAELENRSAGNWGQLGIPLVKDLRQDVARRSWRGRWGPEQSTLSQRSELASGSPAGLTLKITHA